MKRLLLLVATLGVVASPAFAWNEPESFRGVKWGVAVADAEKIIARRQAEYSKKVHDSSLDGSPTCSSGGKGPCYAQGEIGPLVATFGYFFSDVGKFERATFQFDPRNYDTLLRIFTERYGSPTTTAKEPLRSYAGTIFTNDIARWTGGRVTIELFRYRNRFDSGYAQIGLKDTFARRQQETGKAIKKGKDDL